MTIEIIVMQFGLVMLVVAAVVFVRHFILRKSISNKRINDWFRKTHLATDRILFVALLVIIIVTLFYS